MENIKMIKNMVLVYLNGLIKEYIINEIVKVYKGNW